MGENGRLRKALEMAGIAQPTMSRLKQEHGTVQQQPMGCGQQIGKHVRLPNAFAQGLIASQFAVPGTGPVHAKVRHCRASTKLGRPKGSGEGDAVRVHVLAAGF